MNDQGADPSALAPDDALIVVDGLSKAFGLRLALRDVSFRVPRRTILGLLGPNGSGKTTLLRILAALSSPTRGRVTIGGWALPAEAAAVRAQLGVIGHLPLLYDDLTAEENLRFFARLYGLGSGNHAAGSQDRISAALRRVGLAKRARDRVQTFSRGMVQRLAIARSMVHDPPVMLLDEPYTGLDASGSAMLDGLLREWRAEGRTMIVSIHDIPRAASICDRVVILRQGQIVADVLTGLVDDLPDLYLRLTESE